MSSGIAIKQYIPKLKTIFRRNSRLVVKRNHERNGINHRHPQPHHHEHECEQQHIFQLFPPNIHKAIWNNNSNSNNNKKAAILIPLIDYRGQPSLLFTMRSGTLSSHPSEVSFPGGHYDDDEKCGDTSLVDTALREAQEELLVQDDMFMLDNDNDNGSDGNRILSWKEQVEIIGSASSLPSLHGTSVTPIIAVLPKPTTKSFPMSSSINKEYPITTTTNNNNNTNDLDVDNDNEDLSLRRYYPGSPDEVDQVFCISLQELIDVETKERSVRFGTDIPVFNTRCGKKIWGLTAVVIR